MLRSWLVLSLGNDKRVFDDGWIMGDIYQLRLATGPFPAFQYTTDVRNNRLNLRDDVATSVGSGSMRRW